MSLAEAVSIGLFTCRDDRITWANDALADLVGARCGEDLLGSAPASFVADDGGGLPDWPGSELNRSAGMPLECALVRLDGAQQRVRVRPLGRGSFEVVALPEAELPASPLPPADPAEVDALRREVARLRAERGSSPTAHAERVGSVPDCAGRGDSAREREELLAAVSHELQTPLSVIAGFVRLLLSERPGPLADEQRRFLRQAERACERLSKLADDLLQAHPVGAGAAVAHADPRPGDLSALLEEVAADFEALAATHTCRLEVDLDGAARNASFDPVSLTRVVTNLLGNAFAHATGASRVVLASRRVADAIEVRVEDDGPGIPEDERARIFEPWVRGRRARPGKGLGLGLAICRRILEAQGGALLLSPSALGGSRFVFTLPPAPAAPAEAGAALASPPPDACEERS